MSCNLRLYRVGKLACVSKFSYESDFLLNTIRRALFCSLSSLRLSDALQKCQAVLQYVRWGKIAALNSCNLAWVGIRFLSLVSPPIHWLVLTHSSLMWLPLPPAISFAWNVRFQFHLCAYSYHLNSSFDRVLSTDNSWCLPAISSLHTILSFCFHPHQLRTV